MFSENAYFKLFYKETPTKHLRKRFRNSKIVYNDVLYAGFAEIPGGQSPEISSGVAYSFTLLFWILIWIYYVWDMLCFGLDILCF